MSNFEYLNARVCRMRSELLSRASIEELLSFNSAHMVAERLLEGPYRTELAEALAALPPAQALDSALESHFNTIITNITRIADDDAALALAPILDQWDIQNLKAVIRGIHFEVAPELIASSLGPGAALTRDDLETLSELTDIKSIIDQLTSWSMPWGSVLLPLLPQFRDDRNLRPLEHALDAHRFRGISNSNDDPIHDKDTVKLMSMEAELRNVITALTSLGGDEAPLFLPDYKDCSQTVKKLFGAKEMDQAIDILADSPHRRILDKAFPFMTEPGRFAMFERLIDEELLAQSWKMSLIDPLSVAVPCHFLRAKRNEIMNIRLIAMGLENNILRNVIDVGLIFTGAK